MNYKKVIFPLILLILLFSSAVSLPPGRTGKIAAGGEVMGTDTETMIDVNNLQMFVINEGGFAEDWSLILETCKNDGLYFPAGTKKTVVYSAGIWVGGKVNGETRIAIGAYDTPEYFPGPTDADGMALANSSQYKVYKIRKDSSSWQSPTNRSGIKTNTGMAYLTLDSINHYNDWQAWKNEASLDGAPLDSNGNPLMLGDQTLWCVFNDGGSHEYMVYGGGTAPLGVELQATFWGYDLPGALGNTIFARWVIINNSGNTVDSTYISLWADPDLGGASDDLVGCDTTLSLGYCYNATNSDNTYGALPPAIGFDFLQGPLVPSVGDTAVLNDGSVYPDTMILGMSSFNKYTNGTDPDVPSKAYAYMKGLDAVATGGPYIDPETGDTTKYFGAGDPVKGTGWIDSNPSDRRFMLSTGPFTMNPGDTQNVVAAIIVGQGKDRLSSISALKFYDVLAQYAYDVNFDIPIPPPRPTVTAKAYDRKVVLTWTNRSEHEYQSTTHQFEGYRIYQGETVAGPWTQIATFDINNGRGALKDFVLNPDYGDIIYAPVVFGEDDGLQYSIEIASDAVLGGKLHNGKDYYFAVTAYSYDYMDADDYALHPEWDDTSFVIPKGLWYLENRVQAIIVTPMDWLPGTDYDAAFSDNLAEYYQYDSLLPSTSDIVKTRVVDPDEVTGHEYMINIVDVYPDTIGGVEVTPVTLGWQDGREITFSKYWEIWDNTTNVKKLSRQWNRSPYEANPIVDGIEFTYQGNHTIDGLGRVEYINNNTTNPDPITATAFNWSDSARFLGGAVSYAFDFFGSSSLPNPQDLADTTFTDFYTTVELRFSSTQTQRCYNYLRGADNVVASYWICDSVVNDTCVDSIDVTDSVAVNPNYNYDWTITPYGNYEYWGYFNCNFQAWDTINNRQLNVAFVEDYDSDKWDSTWNPVSALNREYLVILNSDYSGDNPGDADTFYITKSLTGNAAQIDGMYILWTGIDGTIDDGDLLRFSIALPADTNDYWIVNSIPPIFDNIELARSALDNIRVVPNPYYCYSVYESDQFDRQVRFMGVPDDFTIRIFNIAGDKIRTLSSHDFSIKKPGDSWAIWDIKTDQGLYVASGIYIWYLEAPAVGSKYGKMAIFPEVEQLKTY